MGCLLIILGLITPRFVLFILWGSEGGSLPQNPIPALSWRAREPASR
jgi:hypothetical protein